MDSDNDFQSDSESLELTDERTDPNGALLDSFSHGKYTTYVPSDEEEHEALTGDLEEEDLSEGGQGAGNIHPIIEEEEEGVVEQGDRERGTSSAVYEVLHSDDDDDNQEEQFHEFDEENYGDDVDFRHNCHSDQEVGGNKLEQQSGRAQTYRDYDDDEFSESVDDKEGDISQHPLSPDDNSCLDPSPGGAISYKDLSQHEDLSLDGISQRSNDGDIFSKKTNRQEALDHNKNFNPSLNDITVAHESFSRETVELSRSPDSVAHNGRGVDHSICYEVQEDGLVAGAGVTSRSVEGGGVNTIWAALAEGCSDTPRSVDGSRPAYKNLVDQFEAKRVKLIEILERRLSAPGGGTAVLEAGRKSGGAGASSDHTVAVRGKGANTDSQEQELCMLRECHLEQLENVQVAIKEQLLMDNMVKYKEMSAEIEEMHRAEVKELTQHYEEQVHLLQGQLVQKDKEHSVRIALLNDTHRATIDALNAQSRMETLQEIERLKSELADKSTGDQSVEVFEARVQELCAAAEAHAHEEVDGWKEEEMKIRKELEELWTKRFETYSRESEEMMEHKLSSLKEIHFAELNRLRSEAEYNATKYDTELQQLSQQLQHYQSSNLEQVLPNQSKPYCEEMTRLRAELEQCSVALTQTKRKLEQSEDVLKQTREAFEKCRRELDATKTELDETWEDCHRCKEELEELRANADSLAQQQPQSDGMGDREDYISAYQRQLEKVEADDDVVSGLRECLAEREAEILALRAQVNAASGARSHGVNDDSSGEEEGGDIMHLGSTLKYSQRVTRAVVESCAIQTDMTLNESCLNADASSRLPNCDTSSFITSSRGSHGPDELLLYSVAEQLLEYMRSSRFNIVLHEDEISMEVLRREIDAVLHAIDQRQSQGGSAGGMDGVVETENDQKRLELLEMQMQKDRANAEKLEQMRELYETDVRSKAAEIKLLEEELRRRDQVSEEGGEQQLLDQSSFISERDALQQANSSLLSVLSDTVSVMHELEYRVTRSLSALDSDAPCQPSAPGAPGAARNATSHRSAGSVGPCTFSADKHDQSVDSSSQSTDIDPPQSESVLTDATQRLQAAVGRVLDQLAEVVTQLRESQHTSRTLTSALEQQRLLTAELSVRCTELEEQVTHESETNQRLTLDVYKLEGLARGYAAERQSLDDQLRVLEEQKVSLVQTLELTQLRLAELEEGHNDLSHREDDLARQRQALETSIGDKEQACPDMDVAATKIISLQFSNLGTSDPLTGEPLPTLPSCSVCPIGQCPGLLAANTKLNTDLRELQRAMERDRHMVEVRLRESEQTNEQLRLELERAGEDRKSLEVDVRAKIEALEKQIRVNKQFLEEQTMEREHERDEHEGKIEQLEALIRDRERQDGTVRRQTDEIHDLEEELKEKNDSLREVTAKKGELEDELSSQQKMILDLRSMIGCLETDLAQLSTNDKRLKERCEELTQELSRLEQLNMQLHDRLDQSKETGGAFESVDLLKRTIHDLQEEVEELRRTEKKLELRNKQLEEELKMMKTIKEELSIDRDSRNEQICNQLRQIAELRLQVDDLKLGGAGRLGGGGEMEELRERLEREIESTERMKKEIADLSEQLDAMHVTCCDHVEDLEQAHAQLETARRETAQLEREANSCKRLAGEEKQRLQAEIDRLKKEVDSTPMSILAQTLIDDKNEEIDQLNLQVDRLNQELNQVKMSSPRSQELITSLRQKISEQENQLAEQTLELTQLRQSFAEYSHVHLHHPSKDDTTISDTGRSLEAPETERRSIPHGAERRASDVIIGDSPGCEPIADVLSKLEINTSRSSERGGHLRTSMAGDDESSSSNVGSSQRSRGADELTNKRSAHLDLTSNHTEAPQLPPLHDAIVFDQLNVENNELRAEITNLNEYIGKLQEDFERVQSMTERQQKEIDSLTAELESNHVQMTRLRAEIDSARVLAEEQLGACMTLRKELHEKQCVIDEKDEELYELMARIEKLEEVEKSLSKSQEIVERQGHALNENSEEMALLREEICELRQRSDPKNNDEFLNLQQCLEDRERRIGELTDELKDAESDRRLQLDLVSQLTGEIEKIREELDADRAVIAQRVKDSLTVEHQTEMNSLTTKHNNEILALQQCLDETRLHMTVTDDDDESISGNITRLGGVVEESDRIDGAVLNQELQQLSGPLQALLHKLHVESLNVLSLSDIRYLRNLDSSFTSASDPALPRSRYLEVTGRHLRNDLARAETAWHSEKRSLLAALDALKQLLATTTANRTKDASQMHGRDDDDEEEKECSGDWRSDLIRAVHLVFVRELEGLSADLNTYSLLHSSTIGTSSSPLSSAENDVLTSLEKAIKQQERRHSEALALLENADRMSLVSQLRSLSATSCSLRAELEESRKTAHSAQEQFNRVELALKSKVNTLEEEREQARIHITDLRAHSDADILDNTSLLAREHDVTSRLRDELSRERDTTTRLQAELAALRTRVRGIDTQTSRSPSSSLLTHQRSAETLEEEKLKNAQLTTSLTRHQSEVQRMGAMLISERERTTQAQLNAVSAIEKLKRELEAERMNHTDARHALEQSERTVEALRREMAEIQENHHHADTDSTQRLEARLVEISIQRDAERIRANEMNSLLERERVVCAELRRLLDNEQLTVSSMKVTISDLRANLDLERSKVGSDLEISRRSQENLSNVHLLTAQVTELTNQKVALLRDIQKLSSLQVSPVEGLGTDMTDTSVRFTTTSSQLQQSISDSGVQRTVDGEGTNMALAGRQTSTTELAHLELLRQRLQYIAIRLQEQLNKARSQRSQQQVPQDVKLDVQSLLSDLSVLSYLDSGRMSGDTITGLQSSVNGHDATPSPTDLNIKILRHNAELTEAITRLISDKQELSGDLKAVRAETTTLRAELSQADAHRRDMDNDAMSLHEQISSLRIERNHLDAVNLEHSELIRELKAELGRTEEELERERVTRQEGGRGLERAEGHATHGRTSAEAENDREKLQLESHEMYMKNLSELEEEIRRLYIKYLRTESFRKALIYQKRYLLLLIGGFQDCEKDTLATIARMGAYPSHAEHGRLRPTPLARFRTAVRIAIAIVRMQHLVIKWNRVSAGGEIMRIARTPQYPQVTGTGEYVKITRVGEYQNVTGGFPHRTGAGVRTTGYVTARRSAAVTDTTLGSASDRTSAVSGRRLDTTPRSYTPLVGDDPPTVATAREEAGARADWEFSDDGGQRRDISRLSVHNTPPTKDKRASDRQFKRQLPVVVASAPSPIHRSIDFTSNPAGANFRQLSSDQIYSQRDDIGTHPGTGTRYLQHDYNEYSHRRGGAYIAGQVSETGRMTMGDGMRFTTNGEDSHRGASLLSADEDGISAYIRRLEGLELKLCANGAASYKPPYGTSTVRP